MKNIIISFLLIIFSQFTFSTEEDDLAFQKEPEDSRLLLPEGYDEFSEVISKERFKRAVKFYFSDVTDVYNIVFSQGWYFLEIPMILDLFSITFTVRTTQGHSKDIECLFRARSPVHGLFSNSIISKHKQLELQTYKCTSDGVDIPVRMIIPASYQL